MRLAKGYNAWLGDITEHSQGSILVHAYALHEHKVD